MGKRSDFKRRPHNAYDTPYEAVLPLVPHLQAAGINTFAEPCCGNGYLVRHLESFGFECAFADDLKTGFDALTVGQEWFDATGADAIITNPPWTRKLMHPLIWHLQRLAPTWLLFDADWAHTKQSAGLIMHCSHIVSVGRVKWMEGSAHYGKDNAAWYRFDRKHFGGPQFIGREAEKPKEAAA